MERALGTVAGLWRWPVESMAGERVNALRIDGRGAGGDRTHAVVHEQRPLTAREAPRLLAWSASYPFNLDAGLDPANPPFAIVRAPGGAAYRWGDPRLQAALAADLGRPVELMRQPHVPRALRITTAASLRALGQDVEIHRFRPNVHLDLDAPPWAELGWEGAELAFAGGVRLRLLNPSAHRTHEQGFGIDARVITGGRLAVGERTELR